MIEVLVWVLTLVSSDGGFTVINNIRSFDDCERLRKRIEAAPSDSWNRRSVVGSCTQIGILVPKPVEQKAPVVNVQPAVPTIENRVIIRKHAP